MEHARIETNGCITYFARYTRQETMEAWDNLKGQGNREARERGKICFLAPCETRDEALVLSALMVREVFAIPTCAHWDGQTFSFYCGGAGSDWQRTLDHAALVYEKYLNHGTHWVERESGPLFANERRKEKR